MPDPETGQADPPVAGPPPDPVAPGTLASEAAAVPTAVYLPFAAYHASEAPAEPAWTRGYDLPSARRVVSSGLQLAVDATTAIRRGSIYIGLLSLGAFGPAVVLVLLGIGRLMSDPATADLLQNDPTLLFIEQPGLVGPLLLIYSLLGAGVVLLVAIGVDAQAIAISILASRASDRPMRLWEAIVRARQVFWRLAGAGFLVGIASTVVTLLITLPFIRPGQSNTGLSFIGGAIGALVVTPFAFASTSIVLGDVDAIEALRRSVRLFRARPRIAFVVTLFTLVTSAIQTFALSAGLDTATRVGAFLHLGLDQGGLGLILPMIVVLAFVIAFGSLTFTIAAIVAAPQVAGFLGLTYYTGGLDRARSTDGVRPRRFRWVTIPMAFAMVALLGAAALGLPTITGFQPQVPTPVVAFLRAAAEPQGQFVSPYGAPAVLADPTGDAGPDAPPGTDIVAAQYGFLPEVPGWFLNTFFACSKPEVTCAAGGSFPPSFYSEGALVFLQRMAAAPALIDARRREWGPVLQLDGAAFSGMTAQYRFPHASHVFLTSFESTTRSIAAQEFFGGAFLERPTDARSMWSGDELITIVPVSQLPGWPVSWDMFAYQEGASVGQTGGQDTLRAGPLLAMLDFTDPVEFDFLPLPQAP